METIESKVEALQQYIESNVRDVPFSKIELNKLLLIAGSDFFLARDMVDAIHFDKAKGRKIPDLETIARECIQADEENASSARGYTEESNSIYGDDHDNGFDYD